MTHEQPRSLSFIGGPFPLLGRTLVLLICFLLVIPAPHALVWFVRWFWTSVRLDDTVVAQFKGRARDIWMYTMLSALVFYLKKALVVMIITTGKPQGGWAFNLTFMLINVLIGAVLALGYLRWSFQARLTSGVLLRFSGKYWALVGWQALIQVLISLPGLLTLLSQSADRFGSAIPLFSLFHLAVFWIMVAYYRWICRQVEGPIGAKFLGTGWQMLWRSIAAMLASLLIIPIPWAYHWLLRWHVRNVEVYQVEAVAGDDVLETART